MSTSRVPDDRCRAPYNKTNKPRARLKTHQHASVF